MNFVKKPKLLASLVAVVCSLILGSAWLTHSRVLVSASPAEPAPITVAYDKDQAVGKLYFSLALLPPEQRKAFYSQFTASQKKAVWSLHVTITQLDIETPTKAQMAVFQKLAVIIHRADFGDLSKNMALLSDAKALEAEAIAALGADGAWTLLNDPGGAVKMKTAYGQKASFDGACACNDYWNYCGDRRVCAKGQDNCTEASSGCGFLWMYPCNGLCKDENAP